MKPGGERSRCWRSHKMQESSRVAKNRSPFKTERPEKHSKSPSARHRDTSIFQTIFSLDANEFEQLKCIQKFNGSAHLSNCTASDEKCLQSSSISGEKRIRGKIWAMSVNMQLCSVHFLALVSSVTCS